MECRRFSQTMASEWQTAFVVSHKTPWCALLTAVRNYNKSLEKLQDFFFKTETKTKTKSSTPRPRLPDPRPRPRLSFLSSRRLETKTLVSRSTPLPYLYLYPNQQGLQLWPDKLQDCRSTSLEQTAACPVRLRRLDISTHFTAGGSI